MKKSPHRFGGATLRLLFGLCLLTASGQAPAFAHTMYQSAVMLDFEGDSVRVELQLPAERLGLALGGPVNAETLEAERAAVTEYVTAHFGATALDGRRYSTRLETPLTLATVDGFPYCIAHLRLDPPPGADANRFNLLDDVILDRIPEQVALVSIRSDWRTSTFANNPKLIGVLEGATRSITVDRPDASWFRGFGSIFHLGMRHIAEGTDHLLFLLSLLLPAPLLVIGRHWGGFAGVRHASIQILKVVTAFTLGHSITLAASALGFVHVPSRPIEVLIAFSILVSAIHAFRPIFPGREAAIAAGFGLIHGLAFATTLAELGLGRWERLASIFGFNLGIEAMQLIIVGTVMPVLILLSRTSVYPGIRVAGALFAGMAATGWLVERAGNVANPMNMLVETLAQHATWVVSGLLLSALLLWGGEKLFSTDGN